MKMYRVPLIIYVETQRQAYVDVLAKTSEDAKDNAHDLTQSPDGQKLVVQENVERRWKSIGLADKPEPMELAT